MTTPLPPLDELLTEALRGLVDGLQRGQDIGRALADARQLLVVVDTMRPLPKAEAQDSDWGVWQDTVVEEEAK